MTRQWIAGWAVVWAIAGNAYCPTIARAAALQADNGGGAADDEESSVDAQLQQELDAALFEGLESELAQPPAAEAPGADTETNDDAPGSPSPHDTATGDPTPHAADATDRAAGSNPLYRAGLRMRAVEQRLGARQMGEATARLQAEVVADLDTLLEQARRRSPPSSTSSGKPKPGSQRQQVDQPLSGPAQPSAQPGGTPGDARDSTAGVRNQAPETPEVAPVEDLMKVLWGHLPERVREQMLQGPGEQFLPKYQTLLEEYFRNLARVRSDSP